MKRIAADNVKCYSDLTTYGWPTPVSVNNETTVHCRQISVGGDIILISINLGKCELTVSMRLICVLCLFRFLIVSFELQGCHLKKLGSKDHQKFMILIFSTKIVGPSLKQCLYCCKNNTLRKLRPAVIY